jgi:hypothetical protein
VEIKEMWQGIPADLFAKVAYRQIQYLISRIDQVWDHISHLVALAEEMPTNTSVEALKDTKLFRYIQSQVRERRRKARWRETHQERLNREIGPHWKKDLDPGVFNLYVFGIYVDHARLCLGRQSGTASDGDSVQSTAETPRRSITVW